MTRDNIGKTCMVNIASEMSMYREGDQEGVKAETYGTMRHKLSLY